MFTGIVSQVGRIERIEARGDRRIVIAADLPGLDLGASVACSGVCLTIVDTGPGWFAVDVSAETEKRTAPGRWEQGRVLNLERSLKVGDELGGHIVTGHVDGVGRVVALDPDGDSLAMRIEAPLALSPLLAEKGSVALDGVSLTVNAVEDGDALLAFSINLIPHTRAVTAPWELGAAVNIEVDLIARYLGRMLTLRGKTAS